MIGKTCVRSWFLKSEMSTATFSLFTLQKLRATIPTGVEQTFYIIVLNVLMVGNNAKSTILKNSVREKLKNVFHAMVESASFSTTKRKEIQS